MLVRNGHRNNSLCRKASVCFVSQAFSRNVKGMENHIKGQAIYTVWHASLPIISAFLSDTCPARGQLCIVNSFQVVYSYLHSLAQGLKVFTVYISPQFFLLQLLLCPNHCRLSQEWWCYKRWLYLKLLKNSLHWQNCVHTLVMLMLHSFFL